MCTFFSFHERNENISTYRVEKSLWNYFRGYSYERARQNAMMTSNPKNIDFKIYPRVRFHYCRLQIFINAIYLKIIIIHHYRFQSVQNSIFLNLCEFYSSEYNYNASKWPSRYSRSTSDTDKDKLPLLLSGPVTFYIMY